MTKQILLVAGLLSVTALACAGDPNKEANDARDAELRSARKQQQGAADDRSESRVNAAEVRREHSEESATGSSATKERAGADARMAESREIYRAKATERLEKADARTAELKALVDKSGGKATTASRDALKTVDTQRGMVTRELGQLPTVANDNWQQAKSSLDAQLDSLEGLVKKAGNEVENGRR